MTRKLRIVEPNAPTTEEAILSFERRHGLKLPETYRRFLLRSNGGRPVPATFPIRGFPDNPNDDIQVFFGLGSDVRTDDLYAVLSDLNSLIPAGVLPIASTGGDDFVCLDLREKSAPVVFWDRRPFWGTDEWSEHDLYPVASDFEAFLQGLRDE